MISISIFDLTNPGEVQEPDNAHFEEQQIVNNFEEKLETNILRNEKAPTGHTNYRIITDTVYNQKVRVKGEVVDQIIRQELYQAYIKENSDEKIGHLITLCKKEDALKVKDIFENRFNYSYEKHQFDILGIINASTDVRGARFNVKIETVSSISMKGTRVNNTQYYARMLAAGELTGVIVTYDTPDQSVTFRISVDGSIFLFSNLDDYQILELVQDLLKISINSRQAIV